MHVSSDHRSNSPEQLEFAARTIGQSQDRLKVFQEVYRGKHKGKTVAQIALSTGMTAKQVLNAGKRLSSNKVIHQDKEKGQTVYRKDEFYGANKEKIIAYVKQPEKLAKLVTKRRPQVAVKTEILLIRKELIKAKHLTIVELDQFKNLKPAKVDYVKKMLEKDFKAGLQTIIGEDGEFQDWSGEQADLWTTRVLYKKTRVPTAFAFKGRGTKNPLTIARMGKNGDQIQRLLKDPAELFVIQFWGQIATAVVEEFETFAKMRSIEKRSQVYYCIIDGQDSNRIVETFPSCFPSVFPVTNA